MIFTLLARTSDRRKKKEERRRAAKVVRFIKDELIEKNPNRASLVGIKKKEEEAKNKTLEEEAKRLALF